MLITNPEFYNGSILLRPQHIKVLGGVVPELYESWKAQEMMAMKNRIRSTIRNAESHPPKFVSFEEFVKMKRRGITPSYQQSTTPVSTQPEVKKIEDLDLTDIQGKRKEALAGVDVKEAGKWGSNKQVLDNNVIMIIDGIGKQGDRVSNQTSYRTIKAFR